MQNDTAVPGGTEVLHVYATDLNGNLPHNMSAEQDAATFHLRGHMDPACLKCLQIREVNCCLKGTYQKHPCAHTLGTLSSASACWTMKDINVGEIF